jgi:flavodoxin
MKTLIVCVSVSHGNTRKVADAMAEVLDAQVVEPDEVDEECLMAADLLGVGSGIFGMRYHPRITAFIDGLPSVTAKNAFVFSTSGAVEMAVWPYSRRVARSLEAKGFDVLGNFSCRGWDTWFPLRLIGGLNKGRPNEADLADARGFASDVANRVASDGSRPEAGGG